MKNSPEITPEMLQQHPELMIAVLAIFILFFVYIAGSIASWVLFAMRLGAGKPMLAVEPWKPRAWGLLDLLLIVVAVFVAQSFFAYLGIHLLGIDLAPVRDGKEQLPISIAMVASLGNVAAMLAGLGWIMFRFQVPPAHVGFKGRQLPRQLLVGLLVALASLPIIYGLMILVSIGFKTEYSHPLIDEMNAKGTLGVYAMGFVTAAIIAPVTEEFLFRVVLQGWLQSIPFKSRFANVLGGWDASPAMPVWELAGAGAPANIASIPSVEPSGPEHAAAPSPLLHSTAGADALPPVWPSIVTGILFGFAHWGYGLSFIPLIALGIVLGLVYRATHSIWPCILIHGMLNGTSMLLLGLTLMMQRAA